VFYGCFNASLIATDTHASSLIDNKGVYPFLFAELYISENAYENVARKEGIKDYCRYGFCAV
jgi:hypothetical protein